MAALAEVGDPNIVPASDIREPDKIHDAVTIPRFYMSLDPQGR